MNQDVPKRETPTDTDVGNGLSPDAPAGRDEGSFLLVPQTPNPSREPALSQSFNDLDPNADDKLVYLCSCGDALQVDPKVGGTCETCGKTVSAKALQHELAQTVAISTEELVDLVDLDKTRAPHDEYPDEDVGSLIGEHLGHFEILSSLGGGGCGQVYRALDTSLQRFVAVKVLKSGIGSTRTSSKKEIDMLLQEAVAQARVTHPNIVTIYYVSDTDDGTPFLAMELVKGMPISWRLEDDRMNFNDIGPVAMDVAKALKYSYELDIIHGDIKPSNIMLQNDGLAKLSDFGMARRVSDAEDKTVGGTPNYIAPELLRGSQPSVQSDMYSLGVTLYEMTFGRLPVKLSGNSVDQWVDNHEETEIQFEKPWPARLPDRWRKILKRLLSKDPKNRFENYDELIEQLKMIQPSSRTVAQAAPRIFATLIDWLTVFLFIAPVQISIQMFDEFFQAHSVLSMLWKLVDFVPIMAYTFFLSIWRQSLGRKLMQLRVVNYYGQRTSGKRMMMRSPLRMAIPWLVCFVLMFNGTRLDFLTPFTIVLGIAICAVDLGYLLFTRSRESLHDRYFKTRVVLDTQIHD